MIQFDSFRFILNAEIAAPGESFDAEDIVIQYTRTIIKSNAQAIHCWRKSTNGVIADNIRIADNTGNCSMKPQHRPGHM